MEDSTNFIVRYKTASSYDPTRDSDSPEYEKEFGTLEEAMKLYNSRKNATIFKVKREVTLLKISSKEEF